MVDSSTPSNPAENIPPRKHDGWTTRRSQIAVLSGLGPSDMQTAYSPEHDPTQALGSSDILILRYMEHNYFPNIPFHSWVHRTSLSNSLGFTNKTIKNRLTILQDVYGLVEHHPEPGKQALYKLTTMGHALMQGQLSATDAKIRKELGADYDPDEYGIDAIVRREVTEIINTRLTTFEENFKTKLWAEAKEEFKQLHQTTMESNFKRYAEARSDGRALAVKNRRIAFDGLTEEIKVQFDEDRKFYQTLHEELSGHVMEMLSAEIKKACASALSP